MKLNKEKTERMEQYLYYLDNMEIIVFDIETTATVPNKDYGRLIEISAVKLDSHYSVIDTFDELIDPEIKINSTTQNLTGITQDMLKGKRKYPDVVRDFIKFCSGDNVVIAGHNISTFDIRFVNYFANMLGLSFAPKRVVDTLFLARNTDYKKKCSSYKLEALANYFGVDDPSHHRAMNDVLVNVTVMNILHQKAKSIGFKPINHESNNPVQTEITDSSIEVKSVNFWKKTIEEKEFKRIYVKIHRNDEYIDVFYDFNNGKWAVKSDQKLKEDIDWGMVVEEIAKFKKFPSVEMVLDSKNY